ncbi:MAG: M24 family metallopeptidase C-terminal domain-containing protein, partial [Pelagibacteraceae bacterium]
GQVTSNEPGYYQKKAFGIRLENLIYLNNNRMFENLTLVPYESSLIITSMLTQIEKNWINNYHEEIYEKIHKLLNIAERDFFRNYCLKIN